jgi:hypoxanthine phosphoribosyltransferase
VRRAPPAAPALTDGSARPLITADAIARRVRELGQEVTRDYQDRDLVVVVVLTGSFMFAADLVRAIELPLSVDFLGVQSYGNATESSGVVRITTDLVRPIEDKDVLVVEDIVDTGLTMRFLLDTLRARGPRSLRVAALLQKAPGGAPALAIDYLGFALGDGFVVGYGLDHAQRWRNLPYLAVWSPASGGDGASDAGDAGKGTGEGA